MISKINVKLAGLVAGIGTMLTAGVAGATSLFTLPAGAVASTTAYIGDLFTDLSVFVYLAIGLPLGFWVIRKIISLVAGRAR